MRAACMPKFKVSEEVANGLAQKVFPDDKVVKCYVNCIMEMMQSMKKGKINYETTLKQIDLMLPEELKPGTKEAGNLHSLDVILQRLGTLSLFQY